jgi:hypothetical protein
MAAAEVDPVSDFLLLCPLPYLRSNPKSSGGNQKKNQPQSSGFGDGKRRRKWQMQLQQLRVLDNKESG